VAVAAVLTVLCYATTPWLPVALAVGGGFLLLSAVRPVAAVSVGCTLAVVEAQQLPVPGIGKLSATELALAMVAAGWCWRALTGDPRVRYPQIADYPVIALVLLLLPGITFGADPADVVRLTVLWGAFFLVFLTVKGFTPDELRWVLLALGLGAGVLGLLGIVGYLQGGGATVTSTGSASGRAVAGIPDPNYYAAYLQLAAVPLLALLVAGRTRWRAVAWVAVVAAGAGVVLSLSRGALLGTVIGVGLVLAAWTRSRWAVATVALVLVTTGLAGLNPLVQSDMTSVVADRVASATVQSENNKRTLLWSSAVDTVIERPQGVGVLQFEEVSRRLGLTERGRPLENVHNTYLNLAVELGVAGLLAYLLWLARTAVDLVVEWRRRRPETFPVVVGLSGALLGYSAQAMTVSQYRVQAVFATFFVLAGAAAAARAWPDPGPQEPAADRSTAGLPVSAGGVT
jgi:O-antigen ligase